MAYMSHIDDNVRQLARRQRQFLILIRDACNALIREVQSSLDSDWNVEPTAEIQNALAHIQIALMDAKSPKEVHELFTLALLKKQSLQVLKIWNTKMLMRILSLVSLIILLFLIPD